jgi:hypothetical protein
LNRWAIDPARCDTAKMIKPSKRDVLIVIACGSLLAAAILFLRPREPADPARAAPDDFARYLEGRWPLRRIQEYCKRVRPSRVDPLDSWRSKTRDESDWFQPLHTDSKKGFFVTCCGYSHHGRVVDFVLFVYKGPELGAIHQEWWVLEIGDPVKSKH